MLPSWSFSFLAHVIIIILLALYPLVIAKDRTVTFQAGESTTAPNDTIDLNLDALDLDTDPLETEFSEVEPVEITEVEDVQMPEN